MPRCARRLSAYAVQLVLRLRDQDPSVTPARQWLDERLTSHGTTPDKIVHEEHQRQGASNITVRNIITSMRLISDVEWPEFLESVSLVDELLRLKSGFAAMEFTTRDLYRREIEQLARGSKHTELAITQAALAAEDSAAAAGVRSRHGSVIAAPAGVSSADSIPANPATTSPPSC